MAVPAGPTEKRYTGNGITKIFTIPFLLLAASDLDVFLDGIEIVSGFTITGEGNPTSTITFAVAPADQSSILLNLNVPFERLNDYQENGDFLSSTVNRDFDRIWQALKQLFRYSTRALTLGFFDVDGAGAYRARGNKISDLADPVGPQDAVTKSWVTLLLDGVSGVINTTTGILYDAGTLFDYLRFGVQRTVDTYAALIALSPTRNQRARTLGYYSPGDGGGGSYFYSGSSWQLVSNGPLNVRQFGAHGDGTANDTPFINLAMEAAVSARKGVHFPTGVYMVDESAPGSGYCILNRGVSMIGEGALRVQIVPVPTLPNTVDYILIKPTTATILDFVEIKGLFTYPNNPGNKRGKRSVYVDMSAVSNSSCFHMEGCYFGPGNDYSFEWFTSTDNPQGGPANSVFERNAFWEGVKLTNAGVAIHFETAFFDQALGQATSV
ncbi:phage tail fiber domain-containing protein [Pseudomonas fluorescens]